MLDPTYITLNGDPDRDNDNGVERGVATKTRVKTKKPSMYRVLLMNDDYTPMEFVVSILIGIFNKSPEEATRIMLNVHQTGIGTCGVFTFEIAETKVAQVLDAAKRNNLPLDPPGSSLLQDERDIMRALTLSLAFGLALFATGCATTENFVERSVITKSKLGFPQFDQFNKASNLTVNHTDFDRFLGKYVVPTSENDPTFLGVNLINYKAVSAADREILNQYVNRLQATKVTQLNRPEQLAFWINLYNADTLRAILEAYPVDSIRSIKSNFFDFKGPWNDDRLTVEGVSLTLDNVENKIIRPIFNDARIHYAVNCAAIGCPNLRNRAYRGAGINQVLDEQARKFINNRRGIFVEDGEVTVSKIFLWYKEDFGQNEAEVLEHIRKFSGPTLKNNLSSFQSIDNYAYDWSLNDTSPAKP